MLIHPGAVLWGSNGRDIHGNADYVMHQDIVYVTINYRLHVLGKYSEIGPQIHALGPNGSKDLILNFH